MGSGRRSGREHRQSHRARDCLVKRSEHANWQNRKHCILGRFAISVKCSLTTPRQSFEPASGKPRNPDSHSSPIIHTKCQPGLPTLIEPAYRVGPSNRPKSGPQVRVKLRAATPRPDSAAPGLKAPSMRPRSASSRLGRPRCLRWRSDVSAAAPSAPAIA